jgi:hypothetical protein
MKSTTLQLRLKLCMKEAELGIAELRWFLGRDYKTVREWVNSGRVPEGVRAAETLRLVGRLERLVARKRAKVFPIPKFMNKWDRSEYMRLLGEGKLGHARVLKAHSARAGALHRPRKEGRSAASKGSQHNRAANRLAAGV